MARQIGMLMFPRMTQLDLTGPYEVLARLPNSKVDLVARTLDPVTSDRGMQIVPTVTYETCPPLDVIMVPGGPGQQDLMEDEAALGFLRRQAAQAEYVTSVCTGSLVLGAAGLLKGRRATSHWNALDHLELLGAIPVSERFRLAVDDELPYVLKLFVLAEMTSSRRITENALESTKQELHLTVTPRRLMSVVIPKIEATFGTVGGMYSFIHTSPELDQAIDSLKKFLPKLIRMAELEEAVRRLSIEIEKTRRRVNALEHTFIPRMKETIKYIMSKLDEMERSNTSRLMKIKAQRIAQEESALSND